MERSCRKAFTLVELAIVLVIIGLIMGMAIKGKSLIQIARMRVEVNKINKFEAAIATYYARIGVFNNMATSINSLAYDYSVFDNNVLLSMGLLKDSDLTSIPHSSRINNTSERQWMFAFCGLLKVQNALEGLHYDFIVGRGNIGQGMDMCAVYLPIKDDGSGMPLNEISSLTSQLVCSIEVMKDDEDTRAGSGRFANNANHVNNYFTPTVFNDCFAIPSEHASEDYAYKVF